MFDHVPLDIHIGSIAVRRWIEARQPRVTLHGHVHESARLTGTWQDKLGQTVMLSAAHDGPVLALVRFPIEARAAPRAHCSERSTAPTSLRPGDPVPKRNSPPSNRRWIGRIDKQMRLALEQQASHHSNSKLDELLMASIRSREVHVPPLAPAALRVQTLVGSGEYTVDSLAEVIQFDHILSAEMMKRANSSMRARGRSVESVQEAVRRLGAKETVNVAISASLGAIAGASGPLQELRVEQWRDSALASMVNQVLAPGRSIDPSTAFLCALFRDFPEIIAVGHVEALLRQHVDIVDKLPPAQWYALVRRHREDIAKIVLEKWDLPPAVAAVINTYKNLKSCPAPYAELAKSVGIAHIVCLLLKQDTALDSTKLGRVPGLKAQDAELLASKLDGILASVVAMQSTESGAKAIPSKVETPPSVLSGPLHPCDAVITATSKSGEATYAAAAIGFDGLQMTGTVEQKTNLLKKFKVDAPSSTFEACFNVALVSSPSEGRFHIELKPFGLGGADKTAWEQLVVAARKAAASPSR